jgi:hypothetical protein
MGFVVVFGGFIVFFTLMLLLAEFITGEIDEEGIKRMLNKEF